jgi:hypothetical protein
MTTRSSGAPRAAGQNSTHRLIRPEGVGAVDGEKLSEPRAGTMDPALDRPYRAIADGGSLLAGEAGRAGRQQVTARHEISQVPMRFARDVALGPGRASAPRMTVPHMLPSSE